MKEDIIVANRAAMEYAAILLPAEYEYRVFEDQSISVLDAESGKVLFLFEAPLAYDSAEPSRSVIADVKLTRVSDAVRLEYALDESFLDEAVFPITIDPVAKARASSDSFETLYISGTSSTSAKTRRHDAEDRHGFE